MNCNSHEELLEGLYWRFARCARMLTPDYDVEAHRYRMGIVEALTTVLSNGPSIR
jgi:hypothetical protein